MKSLLVTFILTVAFNANALIYSNQTDTQKAVIELSLGSSMCTGSVVGLNPPTVITAHHCTDSLNSLRYLAINPVKIFKENYQGEGFSPLQGNGDMVILVFPEEAKKEFLKVMNQKDLFIIDPKISLKKFQEVELCGFGSTERSIFKHANLEVQRCGSNNLILQDDSLKYEQKVVDYNENHSSSYMMDFPSPMKAKAIYYTIEQALERYEKESRFGIASLVLSPERPLDIGNYDETNSKSLIAQGDSGGPLFIKTARGNVLIGVTSFSVVDRDYLQTAIGALFWNVNLPWSKDLIQKAIEGGADIRGMIQKPILKFAQDPTVETNSPFGISAGVTGSINLSLFNAGDLPTTNDGVIKITSSSEMIHFSEKNLPLDIIEARSTVQKLSPIFFTIDKKAIPGSKILISGKILYGQDEKDFTAEVTISFNPQVDAKINYNKTPKARTLFKSEEITINIAPKYPGTKQSYSLIIKEMNSHYLQIEPVKISDDAIKTFKINYKMSKESVGNEIKLQVIIKNQSAQTVYDDILVINPT